MTRWWLVPALVAACSAADPAGVPTEPPPATCVPLHVVKTSVGPTIKRLPSGGRIVAIVWQLSDHHTYVSQTGDAAGPPNGKATAELKPPGTFVALCAFSDHTGAYPYLIRTHDGTNRAAKRTS